MRLFRRDPCVALDHGVCTSMAHRTASTTLRNSMIAAVAGALDDAAMVDRDRGVKQIAAERPQSRESAFFVRPGKPAIADDVGTKDRRKLPGLAHSAFSRRAEDAHTMLAPIR